MIRARLAAAFQAVRGAVATAFRGYVAAQDTRGTTWRPTGGSATDEVGAGARPIALRARDAVRNDPYASRIVDIWAAQAVGAGITTRWAGAPHRAAWKRWAESTACDAEATLQFAGLQTLVMRAVVESGEVFVRLLPVRPSLANPVGLQLQVLESDHLDTSRNGVIDGRPTIQGIALSPKGAPVGYWLYPTHPGASWMLPGFALQSQYVPASECLHIYRKRRPSELRAVSWLAPVLMILRDRDEYEAALLMKAKIEAAVALIVNNEADGTVSGDRRLLTDAAGNAVETFEAGMILYGENGKVDVLNPSTGGSHLAYAKRALEAAAAGVGLTYHQLSGDLTQANYSSLRAGGIEFRRLNEQIQYQMLIPMLVQPVAERFHRHGALLGLWPVELAELPSHVPPAHEMTDPAKDTAALIAQQRAGYVPPQDAVASFGYDFAQMVEQVAQANKAMDAARVVFDTDPRRVAKSGSAQDAAQLAAIELTGKTSGQADDPTAARS